MILPGNLVPMVPHLGSDGILVVVMRKEYP